MKHALLVIFLAGCPTDPPTGTPGAPPPPPYDPHDKCVGFGLTFTAQSFIDSSYFSYSPSWKGAYGSSIKPIAVGGVEHVFVSGAPYIDQTTPEFTALVTGPVLAIDPTNTSINNAAVIGESEGTADLCIYDRGSTELHDGVRLTARPITGMIAVPASPYYQSWERPPTGTTYPLDRWVMFVGARRTVGVALLGEHSWRLVDESMKIETALGSQLFVTPTRETWDAISLDVPTATTLHLRATTRDDVWSTDVAFVDHVDRIEMQPLLYTNLEHLRVATGSVSVCFTALADDALVLAAPFVYGSTPAVVVHPSAGTNNCVGLEPIATGEGSFTAALGDTVLTVPFNVDP